MSVAQQETNGSPETDVPEFLRDLPIRTEEASTAKAVRNVIVSQMHPIVAEGLSAQVNACVAAVEQYARAHGYELSDEWKHHLRLALEEAIVNAFKHGNKGDPEKKLTFSIGFTDDEAPEVVIYVNDEGEGFAIADLPDCTDPENLDKPSGRGTLLVGTFLKKIGGSVHYFPTGKKSETGSRLYRDMLLSIPVGKNNPVMSA